MTRLRISAGPSLKNLTPIEPNSDIPLEVHSDGFKGQVAVYIKGLPDERGKVGRSRYFDHSLRKGITWGIQLQGIEPPCIYLRFVAHILPRPIFADTFWR